MSGDKFRDTAPGMAGRTARYLAHEAETIRFIRMAATMADEPTAVSSIKQNATALLGLIEGTPANARKTDRR